MNRLEEIKERRQKYLDSIRNYVEGEHEALRDEFLYFAEQDIEYLLNEVERLQGALKKIADLEIPDSQNGYMMQDIAVDALKEK